MALPLLSAAPLFGVFEITIMDTEELLEAAKDAASAVFNDTSVSPSETRANLKDLIELIQVMISTLED